MKKKIIPVIICLALVLGAFSGCSVGTTRITGEQDTSYQVIGNGGNSVQYGNYVYFINGTKGYEDADGKQNTYGNVTKGALYRVRLNGQKDDSDPSLFSIAADENGSEFVTYDGVDYYNNLKRFADVQLIAPKVIGTTGYGEGGIYIFDEWIYYASPNNEKGRDGNVQVTFTDFFRTNLSSGKTYKIYTTDAESASSPYSFSKFGGKVYLTCYYNSKVVVVEMTDSKIGKERTLDATVSGAILPYRENYSAATANVCGLEDYIFILREPLENEAQRTGLVIEALSPDLSEGAVLVMQGKTDDALEAVRDGMLFYRSTNASNRGLIMGVNMHETFMSEFPSYKAYQDSLGIDDPAKITENISKTVLNVSALSDLTSTYCFRGKGFNATDVYCLTTSSSGVTLYRGDLDPIRVFDSQKTVSFVSGEYMYYYDTDSTVLKRAKWAQTNTDGEQISHGDVATNGLRPDYCAGYIVYMGTYTYKTDVTADGYTFFKKVDREGVDEQFVGEFIEDDIHNVDDEDDEDDEDNNESGGCSSSAALGGIGGALVLLLGGALVLLLRRKQSRE